VKIRYHVYKDFRLKFAGASDEQIAEAKSRDAAKIARLRYSFVSLRYHPRRRKLFVGATNTRGDILLEFDPEKRRFKSCGFGRSRACDPCDDKIHKGLYLVEDEDALYFATATLGGMARTVDAKGGGLIRYDIRKRKFRCLARPTHGDYHQSSCFDFGRGKAYIWTRRGCFAVWDLERKGRRRYEAMGSTPHNGCIDEAGGVWGTYGPGRQAFYRYDPDRNRFAFTDLVFPNAREAANIMYDGAGPVDSFLAAPDGLLYTASALGELYRIDPRAMSIEFLGKPMPGKRLPAMALADDGWIYMAGGDDRKQRLARYSREERRFEILGRLVAKDGIRCFRSHELAVVDDVVFIGETDHPRRSGYLWACEL